MFSRIEDKLDAKSFLNFINLLDIGLAAVSAGYLFMWIVGVFPFEAQSGPFISPFACFSLLLISGGRLSLRNLEAFPSALTLALMLFTIGGNISSLTIQSMFPSLIMSAFPGIVGTSVPTSIGLILFCIYEIVIILRKTPRQAFIFDDLLLHLAIVPGAIGLLGAILDNQAYLQSATDPRVGVSLIEMLLMATNLIVALCSNKRLFLWQFLQTGKANVLIFSLLALNQYVTPVVVGMAVQHPSTDVGIELFVLFAGVLATMFFLLIQAFQFHTSKA